VTHRAVVTIAVLLLSLTFFASACRQEAVKAAPEANLRALVESSRRAQPPEARAAAVVDLHAGEEESMNPDKHTYTVDPSIQYADLTIRLRPYTQLKGKILNAPNQH
jgi:hypothetical protein